MDDIVSSEKSKLIAEIKLITQFGVSTDLWTHTQSNHSYITVTIQYSLKWKITTTHSSNTYYG